MAGLHQRWAGWNLYVNVATPEGEEVAGAKVRVAFCGHAGSGKDECASWLKRFTSLRYNGGTSTIIARHIAEEDGITVEQAMVNRINERQRWFDKGNELRKDDDAYLARECMKASDILVGVRTLEELMAARRESLFDLSIWVMRSGPTDRTMRYDWHDCDIILPNEHSKQDLAVRLWALAKSWGVL